MTFTAEEYRYPIAELKNGKVSNNKWTFLEVVISAWVRGLETVCRDTWSPRLRLARPRHGLLPVEGLWRDRVLVKSVASRFDGSRLSQEVGQLCRQYWENWREQQLGDHLLGRQVRHSLCFKQGLCLLSRVQMWVSISTKMTRWPFLRQKQFRINLTCHFSCRGR